jgi:hypothetical protein
MNVVSHDATIARETRAAALERAPRPAADIDGDLDETIDNLWRPLAEEQLRRRQSGHPLTHRLLRLPHVSRRTEALRGPINGLLVDG